MRGTQQWVAPLFFLEAAMAAVQTVPEIPTGSDATSCRIDLDIDRDPQCRLKGFLGVSAETVSAMDQTVVEKYKVMSNAELFAIGEKALGDIADDIIALDEIRNRFRKGHAILGYANWKDFVQRNSKYSLRTAQRRLSEKNGKDESKVNDRYKTPMCAVETTPEVKVEVGTTFGGNLYVHEHWDNGAYDGSNIWLVENTNTGLAELWRSCDLTRITRKGERVNKCKYGAHRLYGGAPSPEEVVGQNGEAWWAQQKVSAQNRLNEIKGGQPAVESVEPVEPVESVEPAPEVEPQHKESLADWLQKQVRKIALQPYGYYAAKFDIYPWQHPTERANVEGSMIEIYKEIAATATKLAGELAEKYDVPAPVVIPISGCEDLPSRRK